MRQHVYTIFIIQNHASFHLWWNKNLVKHQKVSKYFENYCSWAYSLENLEFFEELFNWLWNIFANYKLGNNNKKCEDDSDVTIHDDLQWRYMTTLRKWQNDNFHRHLCVWYHWNTPFKCNVRQCIMNEYHFSNCSKLISDVTFGPMKYAKAKI